MRHCALSDENGTVLVPRLEVAETVWETTVGLLGRAELAPGGGLLLPGCRSIHMFFMRFPIDAVFLDDTGVVRRVAARLRPWRLAWCPEARDTLELSAGAAAERFRPGQRVRLIPEKGIEHE